MRQILNLESRAFLLDILRGCQGGKSALDVIGPARKFAMNLSLTISYGTRYVSRSRLSSTQTSINPRRLSVEDLKDFSTNDTLKEIIYIEEEISRLRETASNYANYIPLLRPLNTMAAWLGLQDGSHLTDVGKRRYAYHAALQANLRAEIAANIDKPCIQGNVLKDPESKGLSEGELLSISLSMMAGADTSKRTIMWACLLLSHRPDLQEKAYRAIADADPELLTASDVAHSKVEYVEALVKELGRYFVVLRLALPKATHTSVTWNGAVIPPNTLLFLNSWACSRGMFSLPSLFLDSSR